MYVCVCVHTLLCAPHVTSSSIRSSVTRPLLHPDPWLLGLSSAP